MHTTQIFINTVNYIVNIIQLSLFINLIVCTVIITHWCKHWCDAVMILVAVQVSAGAKVLRDWGVLSMNGDAIISEVFQGSCTGQIQKH